MEAKKLIEYIDKGYGILRIARAEGVSSSTIRYWLERYNLKTRLSNRLPKPQVKCLKCDNIVLTRENKYCSACIEKRIYNRKTEGVSFEALKTDRKRKVRLLLERGHRCENCGLTEWMGNPITLELHHVNGDADNNTKDNLQLLCPNCHSLTPTFRSRNRASESRRKVYRKRYCVDE